MASVYPQAGFLAKSAVLAARGLLKAGSGMGLVYYGEEIKGLSHAAGGGFYDK